MTTKINPLIAVGETAPDFEAKCSDGSRVHLAEFIGVKNVLIMVYPGDGTPICTAQLCEIRDEWSELKSLETVAYGINPAGQASHARFAEKNRLPFPLALDEGGKIAAQFGCKLLFGMTRRAVIAIDKGGRVIFAQSGKPQVIEILKALKQAQEGAI